MENEITIRTLFASEIDARVKTWDKNGFKWAMILLYKDARVDQRLMDETFGAMNWKRSHELIDGKLFCTVSVWNEKAGQWVSKQDVGVESDTEKEKGQASDAFKRACFNWGIGRELYTAPSIFLTTTAADYKNGKFTTRLTVKDIDYNDKREITKLVLADEQGHDRFAWTSTPIKTVAAKTASKPAAQPQPAAPKAAEPELSNELPKEYSPKLYAILEKKLQQAVAINQVSELYKAHIKLFSYKPWHELLVAKKAELKKN